MENVTNKSIQLLRNLPRMSEINLVKNPYKPVYHKAKRGARRIRYTPNRSNEERQRWHPLGYEQGRTGWYLQVPTEKYYKNFDARRQYPPLTLLNLQMQIDLGLIDTNKPIDVATLCNANHYELDPASNHYGVHLTDEGMDNFEACVNIEVQYAREPVIAAIERNGGRIMTAFFDIKSVSALSYPYRFFKTGEPIPKRLLPPRNAIDYYTDPKNRGYLADPVEIEHERNLLAQKYGYELPDINDHKKAEMLKIRKHIRQVFYGLEPGYVVNLSDEEILEPLDEELREYYGLPKLAVST